VENSPIQVGSFSVIGFSIVGKAVDSNGKGIQGVKILIDGQQKAITNEQGTYKLDEITPGAYILEGVHEHYFFDAMNIVIKPQVRQIAELVSNYYHLCGKIEVDAKENFSAAKRAVVLNHGGAERRTTTDEKGEFCFELKPGKYTVSLAITPEEKEKGLRLIPQEHNVKIESEPILDLKF